MLNIIRNTLAVLFLISIFGCGANQARLHNRLQTATAEDRPKQLTILPADVEIHRFTAGGAIEEVPEWSEESTKSFQDAIDRHISKRKNLTLQNLPELTEEEKEILEEHIALYGVVGPAAVQFGSFWKHKQENYDYSIGPGLKFLKDKTGSDTALFINAVDIRSTGGRAALMIGAAIFGVGIPMGGSQVYLSVVDLETGDILWNSNAVSPGSFSDVKKIEKYLKESIDNYLKVFPKSGEAKVAKANK